MTRQIFHDRLRRLILAAHRGQVCPACCVSELLCAAGAIIDLAGLSHDDFERHGIANLALAPDGTYDPAAPYDGGTRH